MWRHELGVEVDLRQIERKVFYAAQSRLDYDISASSWVGDYNDANTFLDLYTSNSGNNRTGWKSPRYDQLLQEANSSQGLERRAEEPRIAAACLAVGGGGLLQWGKSLGLWRDSAGAEPLRSVQMVDPIYFIGRFAPHPLLMLSAEHDELIPRFATEALYSAAGQPKQIAWFNSGHVLPPQALLKDARAFFIRYLGTRHETAAVKSGP